MTEARSITSNILSTYLNVDSNCHALPVENTPNFWRDLMAGTLNGGDDGCFVFGRSFEENSGVWECHPQGDEMIFLLDGEADVILNQQDGQRTVELRIPGDFVRIPEGVWHRFHVVKPGKTLTLASGKGSQHRKA
jgi:mannose-6-phosphate isomerase-like protein (cupin superfamily)